MSRSKPRRLFSKRITMATIGFAMLQPTAAMFVDPDLYGAAMTGAVAIITAALGGYMGTGHADYRASLNLPAAPSPLDPLEHGHDRAG